MRSPALALLLLLATLTISQARIGETQAQVEARYGKPLSEGKPSLVAEITSTPYLFGKYLIIVDYLQGASVAETVKKTVKGDPQKITIFDPTEMKQVLAAMTDGSEWTFDPKKNNWECPRNDGTKAHVFDAADDQQYLVIESEAYRQAYEASLKAR